MPGRIVISGRKNKYNARKTVSFDGKVFDSKAECSRYEELKGMEIRGEIFDLRLQVKFDFVVNRVKIGSYRADFMYRLPGDLDLPGNLVVEDVKSKATRTRDYLLRKKLMKALHGIDVQEIVK